ncbi:TPA: ribosome-associated translation inhibitor RaiA [Candidatus Uhrbacteria bacterium]|nr:ribosome-associated translation inhibitor RaiA [Candidatus Uhrbacteria bacterium]
MNILSTLATHMEMTEAIKNYVQEKLMSLEKFTERYSTCEVSAEVGKTSEHHQKGKIFRAEFMMTIPGVTLRAEAVEEDLYAAIDAAKDDLKRQLIEHKERLDERKG